MKKQDLTKLYIHIEQGILLIPLLYILTVSGSNYQVTEYNFITFAFEAGLSLIPRIALLFTSFVYRTSRNEVITYFFLAVLSLVLGILASKTILHKRNQKKIYHQIVIAFLCMDLLLRLLPMRFNRIFDLRIEIFSFLFRVFLLYLMVKEERNRYQR